MADEKNKYAKFNTYSPELLATIPKDLAEADEVIFSLVRTGNKLMEYVTTSGETVQRETTNHSVNILREETITDPANGGTPLDVALFRDANKTRQMIQYFDKSGEIRVKPKNQRQLFLRLMFSEYNKSNPNPYHVAPPSGYHYEILRPEKSEKGKREERLERLKAMELLETATVAQLLRLAPKAKVAVPSFNDPAGDALRNNFADVASGDPKLIISLLMADEESLYTLVDAAVQNEIIRFDHETSGWIFVPSNARLTSALPGVKAEDAMVTFLVLPENESIKKAFQAEVIKAERKR